MYAPLNVRSLGSTYIVSKQVIKLYVQDCLVRLGVMCNVHIPGSHKHTQRVYSADIYEDGVVLINPLNYPSGHACPNRGASHIRSCPSIPESLYLSDLMVFVITQKAETTKNTRAVRFLGVLFG